MGIANKLFFLIGFISVSLWLSACSVQEEAAASGNSLTGDDETTVDNGEVGQDIDVEDFKVSFDTSTEYTMQWSADSDNNFSVSSSEYGSECIGTEGNRIQCILDMDELDLWVHGYTMNIELPGSMCAYLGQKHFYFASANIGEMPNEVHYIQDPDTGDVSNARFCFPSEPCTYNAAAVGTSVDAYEPGDSPTLNRSVWITVDTTDDIKCPYDYTAFGGVGKNCCTGKYRSVVYNALDLTDVTETEDLEWGGSAADCFQGPAMDDDLDKISEDGVWYNGFPQYHVTEVIGNGYGTEYTVFASTSWDWWINLYYANYFYPSDHVNGNETCPTISTENLGIDDGPATCPLASGGIYVSDGSGAGYAGYPFFTFDCLDHNMEVVSRIDVLVREWNLKDELAKKSSGNPDSTGNEPSPFSPRRINDYCDWNDWNDGANACQGFNYSSFNSGMVYFHKRISKSSGD